jgi:hypothetical protein
MLAAAIGLLASCENRNIGRPPPLDELFFPSGMLLDPRVELDENGKQLPAKYLFVVNSNNDLSSNAGTVVAIDLEKFYASWSLTETVSVGEGDEKHDVEVPTFVVDPYCDPAYAEDRDLGDGNWVDASGKRHAFAVDGPWPRCVHDVGSTLDPDHRGDPDDRPDYPCRRLALLPQVVECDESTFIARDQSVRTGDFGTVLVASCNDADAAADRTCSKHRLWLPVRGDPSVTWMDLETRKDEDGNPVPRLECGQDHDKDHRCDEAHRLLHLLNDDDLVEMDREPFNLLVSPSKPYVYVAHSDGTSLSLIDRRHPSQCCVPSDEPTCNIDSIRDCVCTDQTNTLEKLHKPLRDHDGNLVEDEGERPSCCEPGAAWGVDCIARAESHVCDTVLDPGVCTPAMIDQTVAFPALGGLPGGFGIAERPCTPGSDSPSITIDCERPLVYAGFRYSRLLVSFTVQGVIPEDIADDQYEQHCAVAGEIDQPHTIVCDPRVRSQRQVFPGGLDPGGASFTPVLGDIAFSDNSGDHLLVVQTNPGALLLLDTSVGPDGEVVDNPSRPPLEICDQPTRMKLYEEAGQHFALISCYRAALIYVVDLDAFRVLRSIVAGTGPFELEVDVPRRLLYVTNNLENSISVIDLARDRSTRFSEIARIGLQDPFSR